MVAVEDARLARVYRVSLTVGEGPRRLFFAGSNGDECLRVGSMDKSLAATDWRGGLEPLRDTASWVYRKGRTKLTFAANGSLERALECVTEITVLYH